jgi:hypothetical protein
MAKFGCRGCNFYAADGEASGNAAKPLRGQFSGSSGDFPAIGLVREVRQNSGWSSAMQVKFRSRLTHANSQEP